MDRNALSRATEPTSSPTPGYLYLDISKNAATSPSTCTEISKYLIKRLSSKSNPNIKYKCLRVLTKVCADPSNRGQFKRVLVQDHESVGVIKAHLNIRGAPDPARGDEPWENIRGAAKECLDAVYSDSTSGAGGVGGMGGGAMGGVGGGGMGSMQGIGGGGGGAPGGGGMGGYGHPVAGSGYGGGYGSAGGSYSGGAGGGGGGMGPPDSAPPGAHPHATRKMEGIGNPQFRDPRLDAGGAAGGSGVSGASGAVKNMVASAAEGFKGIIADPLARNVPGVVGPGGPGGAGGGGGSYGGPSGSYGNPPGRSELSAATNGQWTMASNRGPNAVGAAPQFAHTPGVATGVAAANRGVGGSWGAGGAAPSASGMSVAAMSRAEARGGLSAVGGPSLPASSSASAPAMGSGNAGHSASDGSYERNLVMELCPPGGMKAEPPPDKLAQFVRAVPSLDPDLVCPVLLDCLEDGQPWIIKAKALCVIEKTILAADEQGVGAYAAFFHACAGEIEPLAVHSRAAIKDPARRVLKALGLDAAYSSGGGAAAPQRAKKAAAPVVAEAPNLLDFDEPAPAAAPAAEPSVPDMLGGDAAPPTAPPPPPAAAPPPPAAPAAGGGDMFGGLTTKSKPAPPATAAPPAPAPAPAASASADLFGDMQVKASTSAEAPQQNGAAQAPAAPASGGSAFGFMNGAENGDAPAAAPPAPAAAAPAAAPVPAPAAAPKKEEASFDPLLSLSAPSEPSAADKVAKTQAQIAQMQAMQYQQQMMMMQQQMAQMQMAMAGKGAAAGGAGQRPSFHQAAGAGAGVNPNVMSAHNSSTSAGFSFIDSAPGAAKKEQEKKNHAFDFISDDIKKG